MAAVQMEVMGGGGIAFLVISVMGYNLFGILPGWIHKTFNLSNFTSDKLLRKFHCLSFFSNVNSF